MARYTVLSETNNIDTNWSTFLTILRDLEHRFIPTKTINMNGRRRNTFPIDKKTRDLIKRKNTLSKKVASSSDHPIRQEYNRVRNKVKGAVNKMKKKFEKDLYENAKKNPKAIRSYIKSKSKTREGIGDLHIDPEDTNSEKTEDNKKKANILSDYFSRVFTNEPLGELPQMIPVEIQYELKDLVINKDMVLKLLHNLKTDKWGPSYNPTIR
jgi:hypothetical protein